MSSGALIARAGVCDLKAGCARGRSQHIGLTSMSVNRTERFLAKLVLTERRASSPADSEGSEARLAFSHQCGSQVILHWIGLLLRSQAAAQRIRLATQIGSSLVGVLYILDEPSIGLHQRITDACSIR